MDRCGRRDRTRGAGLISGNRPHIGATVSPSKGVPAMNQTIENVESGREGPLARTAMLDYGLHIAGLLLSMGILSVVALIINYVKRPSSRGTIFESHFTWQIRTFWWT